MNETLKQPMKQTDGAKLSLFMPTHLSDPENRQDPIVFKNLLRDAEEKLKEFPEGTLVRVMDELNQLQKDIMFWNRTKGGIGILASEAETRIHHLTYPVPASIKIGHEFHVLPLLRYQEGEPEAFLADISRNRLRLYYFDGHTVKAVRPAGLEQDFYDLFDDFDPDSDGGSGNFNGLVGSYHGGWSKAEEERKDREKYFRYLDNAFTRLYKDQPMPVILSGTTENLSAFREIAKGDFYAEAAIDKPLDSLNAHQIRDTVTKIMEDRRKAKYQKTTDMASVALSDNRAETDLAKIRKLAQEGRVAEFLVNEQYISEDSQELDSLINDLTATGAKIKPMAYEDESRPEPYLAILRY
ncbi:Bacterial archaeo-eukaryotic release factor family 3 [anaerobic digester metagenome]